MSGYGIVSRLVAKLIYKSWIIIISESFDNNLENN